MLASWFHKQSQAYWLVNAETHQQAIKQNGQLGFSDALPLFHGPSFEQVMPLSPWLIPSQPELQNVSADVFKQGIGFSSDLSMWEVLEHLRSLLYVALDGEEVMFRFYDIKVLAPMLKVFSQDEINAFLGNIQQVALMFENELTIYNSTRSVPFQLQKSTWWKIAPQHLEPLYQVEAHAKALERRLWAKLPSHINQLDSPSLMLQTTLQSALDKGATTDEAESIALVNFAHLSNISCVTLAQALLLNSSETQELIEIEKELS